MSFQPGVSGTLGWYRPSGGLQIPSIFMSHIGMRVVHSLSSLDQVSWTGSAPRGDLIFMSVKLNTRQAGDVTVIDISGRVTLGEGSSAIREALRDLTVKGNKKILLNLSDVSYIDSTGIGELVAGFTTAANAGGTVKLLGLTKHVKDVLQISKLYTVFEAHDDEAAAVRSFA